jgi:hypothetical protein
MSIVMDYINANSDSLNITVRYSTLNDYFSALHAAATAPGTGFTFPILSASAFQVGVFHKRALG